MGEDIHIPECDFSQSSYKLMIDNRIYFRISRIGAGPVHLIVGGLTALEAEAWNHLSMGVDDRDWMIKIATFADENAAKLFIEQSQVMILPLKNLKANNENLRNLLSESYEDENKKISTTELISLLFYGMIAGVGVTVLIGGLLSLCWA